MPQLSADCIYEILENLKEEYKFLHSCCLINRLWCKISVRILWRNSRKYNNKTINTIISCLTNKSKFFLQNNCVSILETKPPMFNYPAFIKILDIKIITDLIKNQKILIQNQDNCSFVLEQEIFKLFMRQISPLNQLYYLMSKNTLWESAIVTKDYFKNLSELHCYSNIEYDMSQICHKLSSLFITSKMI